MKLVPVVVLVREDDLDDVYGPLVEQVAETGIPTMAMTLNGWTDDMVRWASLLHAFAEFIRSGDVEVIVTSDGSEG